MHQTIRTAGYRVCSWALVAMAAPISAHAGPPPQSTVMTFGTPALPPLAYVKFCQVYKGECDFVTSGVSVELTQERWRLIEIVNTVVNDAIRSEEEEPGKDEWHLGAKTGDCDEFVAEKRHHLIAQGFPADALSFTEVKDAHGDGHLVLTVHTDRGAYVLDNMRRAVLPWTSTGYQFVKLSSPRVAGEWLEIVPSPRDVLRRETIGRASR